REIRPGHGHKLQNEGGGDVGQDAQRKHGAPPEIAAAEQIDNAQDRTLALLNQLPQNIGVDTGRGQEGAQPIHGQYSQSKQDPPAQIGNPKHIGESFEKLVHDTRSTLPPARAIFSSAERLKACARTVSATFSSPSPRIFMGREALCVKPRSRKESGVTTSPAAKDFKDSRFTTS